MSVPINRDEKVLIALTHRHKIKRDVARRLHLLKYQRCEYYNLKQLCWVNAFIKQAFVSFLQRSDGQLNR